MNETYCDISYADEYMEGRISSSSWDSADSTKKQRALISATRLIDNLNFAGQKKDSSQALEFPRTDQDDVPAEVKNACCEIAYALLDGRDPEFDAETINMVGGSMEGARVAIDGDSVDMPKIHGIPSSVAWGLLSPFFRDWNTITLRRA